MTEFSDYSAKYPEFALSRDDGVVHLRFHTNGGEWIWSAEGHRAISEVMHDLDTDRANRVLVLSATGDNWINSIDLPSFRGISWDVMTWEAKRYFRAMLDLEIPVIAAVHGRCTIHAEIALMSDIVLASPTATFGDSAHLPRNVVPGDGTHIIWSALLGPNRSRYLLMGEQILSAQEALDAGMVAEIHPPEELLERAFVHARRLAAKPSVVARNTRTALIRPLRKAIEDGLAMGLALQGAAYSNRPHRGEVPVELDDK
ncbi:enoyl-CoA hydratase/isomerase family protein [Mesorhizobium sp. CGMCC 1.15528]|uniref:Enoyl-CoA hydratase/isomerase family protein n=1 Tax=Mesorhizobium zhangyense TaxID=1776730 RepID=A0A7C9VDY0_9HYPH|nr:enoyl-CoA hydratase/isomerase family protein [Mesorhizobium zhangyense]NGN42969.1 enoyl-CoA hydratase/isomerase family protein [Mesorhizobium zhangyense]